MSQLILIAFPLLLTFSLTLGNDNSTTILVENSTLISDEPENTTDFIDYVTEVSPEIEDSPAKAIEDDQVEPERSGVSSIVNRDSHKSNRTRKPSGRDFNTGPVDSHLAELDATDDVVLELVERDQMTFIMEQVAKEKIIKLLKRAQKSNSFRKNHEPTIEFKKNLARVTQYQGQPIDIYLLLIMPLIMARLFSSLIQKLRPKFHKSETIEYPFVPIIYFQQTYQESIMKRDSTKQLSSIASNFIIRANETYIDLEDVRNASVTWKTLTGSPKALIKFVTRIQTMYNHAQKLEDDKLKIGTGHHIRDENKEFHTRKGKRDAREMLL